MHIFLEDFNVFGKAVLQSVISLKRFQRSTCTFVGREQGQLSP